MAEHKRRRGDRRRARQGSGRRTATSPSSTGPSSTGPSSTGPSTATAGGTSVVRDSAWMALGTIVSRLTGFLRAFLLVAVIGTGLNANLFSVANTLPNSAYILVAGGVFNVVLVPQLVRAMRNDEDRGQAYADRIITLGLIVLGIATVLLVLASPLLVDLLMPKLSHPKLAHQRWSANWLMALCMPQVFFYGAFVLVGQILNARKRFGPMMWAPILNNVVAVAVIGLYVVMFGRTGGSNGFTGSQILLLAGGSTVGIVVQAAALLPYLKSVGYRWSPRFDFRGVGLGHTLKLGGWTLGFIVVNQIAYFTIVRLASSAAVKGRFEHPPAPGQPVYDLGFLIAQLPHGVITVSLATAIIPTMSAFAAEGRLDRVRGELTRTARMTAVLVVPMAVATATMGTQIGALIGSFSASGGSRAYGTTIAMFSLSMVSFTLHYLMLRGFYALEDTHTPFYIQSIIAASNVTLATVLVHSFAPMWATTMLALSIGSAYTVGLIVSSTLLSRRIGRIVDARMVRFVVRVGVAAALTALVLLAGNLAWRTLFGADEGSVLILLHLLIVGALGAATYFGAVVAMRVEELTLVTAAITRRAR